MRKCFVEFGLFATSGKAAVLLGNDRDAAAAVIIANHYTRSVPSGKSYYVGFEDALVVWSIPANKNIAVFLLGWPGKVWELSRLWAPDGHARNLLTRAISAAVEVIRTVESPDALVSYADPSAGHSGGVYRAASWIYHGRADENRAYRGMDGSTVARRAFHSGSRAMTKAEIEASGFTEIKLAGKERFVRPLSRRAKKAIAQRKPAILERNAAESLAPELVESAVEQDTPDRQSEVTP